MCLRSRPSNQPLEWTGCHQISTTHLQTPCLPLRGSVRPPNHQSIMNWESYEDAVKGIYERLGAENGVRVICHGRDCKVKGKSGVEHQVDVLLEHSDGLHTYHTAIECKYWDKRRPKDDVTKLAEILEDAHLHKGVIVSKRGFTDDAVAFARYKNIELVELRQPTAEDWKGRIRDIHLNMIIRNPILSQFRLEIPDDSSQFSFEQSQGVDPSQLFVHEPGRPPKTLQQIINELISMADIRSQEPQVVRRELPQDTTISDSLGSMNAKILAIQFLLEFESAEERSVIKGEDHVAMILQSIFDNRRFVVDPVGNIRESQA